MNPVVENLGLRLSNTRVERGLTQRTLSMASGVPQPQIASFESGARTPTILNLARLRKALGCTWEALLGK